MVDELDLVLASASPRRKQLLKDMGFHFRVVPSNCEETYPEAMPSAEIPQYLSLLKAKSCNVKLTDKTLIISADTIVWNESEVLGKPETIEEASQMLRSISGKTHFVTTGVTLLSKNRQKSFSSTTKVKFFPLTDQEISYYINTCKPIDKAGAYGIQEWIGYIGVETIDGCFYNVMGLPTSLLFQELKNW